MKPTGVIKVWAAVGALFVAGVAHSQELITLGSHVTEIRRPTVASQANLVLLPGWSFIRTDWCDRSAVCSQALAAGYTLILPEMGKSIYATRLYPETRADWRRYPTLTWVTDTLIPDLQRRGLLLPSQRNYLLGLSTGARGVVLMALRTDTLFCAGAALSGDYDPTLLPNDNLMKGFYGPYAQFPERWTGPDNPLRQARLLRVPLYLGQGLADAINPPRLTRVFYEAIKEQNPSLPVTLHEVPGAGHDYRYWGSEWAAVHAWFQQHGR